ncbi:hypothetical protein LZ32DRAFT_205267 [Colletotrichum eremochloae]|nr:hypothetical protein LZ32DRAFT_205267 [Colletotrichum eremochloae]
MPGSVYKDPFTPPPVTIPRRTGALRTRPSLGRPTIVRSLPKNAATGHAQCSLFLALATAFAASTAMSTSHHSPPGRYLAVYLRSVVPCAHCGPPRGEGKARVQEEGNRWADKSVCVRKRKRKKREGQSPSFPVYGVPRIPPLQDHAPLFPSPPQPISLPLLPLSFSPPPPSPLALR